MSDPRTHLGSSSATSMRSSPMHVRGSRRHLLRALGIGALGAAGLSGCDLSGLPRPGQEDTAPSSTAPPPALRIAQIGTAVGLEAAHDSVVDLAINEARIDVDLYGRVFDQKLDILQRHVVQDLSEDLSAYAQELAAASTAVAIVHVPDEMLERALPAFVDAGILVVSVNSSAVDLRAGSVDSRGLLARLVASDTVLAQQWTAQAIGSGGRGEDQGEPGTIALVAPRGMRGASLESALTSVAGPQGGRLVHRTLHAADDLGDADEIARAIVATRPALVVLGGGPEEVPLIPALRRAVLGPDGRPTLRLPIAVGPYLSHDHDPDTLGEEGTENLTGVQAGGELNRDLQYKLLARDHSLTDFSFAHQAYDAVVMVALAALIAGRATGTDIAQQLAGLLEGTEECTTFEECRPAAADGDEIAYRPRSGELRFDETLELVKGSLRTVTWSADGRIEKLSPTTFGD
ncbi:hypothetical protein JSY14_00560 [Brachybacterium sp. EF45031]|uniref:hypothetical protein n=1 Tax=Brachybacterium sillae TaxID=2810536 RepID=UPI00217DFC9D|nr:hypothetical protein [Brachybacterium sillae]MCS6710583.1 hypothetical protein [Brachybacterium sillae]